MPNSTPAPISAPATAEELALFVPFLRELAALAREILQPLFLASLDVITKSDESPVTRADRAAEAALRARIEERFPTHAIVGEEHGNREGRGYRWVLDPIDGTRAFISNCFLFGTLIALERDDGEGFRPVLGCIAHPSTGHVLIGHRGEARLFEPSGAERTVRVRAPRALGGATVLYTSMPWSKEQGPDEGAERVGRAAGMARTWGDCFGYFAIATGGADVMVDPRLSYWDMAAVVPVMEGAGASVSAWPKGDPLRQGSMLVCTGPALMAEVRAVAAAR